MTDLDKAIKKIANKRKVEIFEVTEDNAEEIHGELRKGGRARELTKGKVRTEFMYNYFSCKHGSYLGGSTKLDGAIPADREYSRGYSKSNFWWNGLRIFALRQKTGTKDLCGFVVMHNAYLSMYPGSDEEHYNVDPVMKANGENITDEIGNERLGSKLWTDVPILCGSGCGDLLIALALAKCGMEKVIVSVASAGEDNEPMNHLLERWGFKRLEMTHPETGEPWQDEEGEDSHVMYRDTPITAKEIVEHASEGKKTGSKKEKKSKRMVFPKMSELKEKTREKLEKLKLKQEKALATKEEQLLKLKRQIKEKDAIIAELRSKAKGLVKVQKASKAKILSLVKSSFENVLGEELAAGVTGKKRKAANKKREKKVREHYSNH